MTTERASEAAGPINLVPTAEERQYIEAYRWATPARRQWLFRMLLCLSNGMDYYTAWRVAGAEPPR